MAIDYTYKITQLEKAPSLDGLSDVVTRARVTYTGVDSVSGYSGSFQGATPMPAPNSGSFTPLADLTEDEVIEWVKVTHPTDHMQEMIQKQIDRQIAPKYEPVPLPWDPTPAPTGSIPPTV
jgi:hypothetical protein